jgi:cytochrome b561
MAADTQPTYTRGAIAFHWTIALLIIGNLIGGLIHESVPQDLRGTIMSLHKATGITILVLSFARLAWRLTHRPPPLPGTVKSWEKGLAHAVHWGFYIMMIALPLTGWLMVSAGSRKWPLNWYGLFDIPFLPVAQDKIASSIYADRHELLGYITIGLLALHLAGAIKHQFLDRDRTVFRMLPWVKLRNS